MMKEAQKFYEGLGKGIIWGMKCKKCGKYTFPPKAFCRECGSANVEFVKMSGEGKLLFYSTSILPPKKFEKVLKYAYGLVQLKEGPCFMTQIKGVDFSSPEKMTAAFKKLPIRVKAQITKLAGMNIVVFKA